MRQEKSHPSWWQLYLLGLVMIGLLVLGAWAPSSEFGHQVAAIGALLLICGLVELWLRANRRALLHVSELLLSQNPRQNVVRETSDEEQVPIKISWRPSPETETALGGNGDHGTEQATEEVSAPAERIELIAKEEA
jgi:hypothetical protein